MAYVNFIKHHRKVLQNGKVSLSNSSEKYQSKFHLTSFRKIKLNEACHVQNILITPRSRSQPEAEGHIFSIQLLKNYSSKLFKLYRKVKHNEVVCHEQN